MVGANLPPPGLNRVKGGGVRIFFDFAKTNELILSCWLSYWMSNQEYINFHHFWPFYGHFWAKFAPKCLLLAIGSPSSPKWVGHWVNMVGHCWTDPGGEFEPFGTLPICFTKFQPCSTHLGRLGIYILRNTAFFGQNLPYLGTSGTPTWHFLGP